MLTNREFHLQTGNLGYKTGLSFTNGDSWVTNGILGLLFTMIADYFIKNGHKYDNFSLEEKEKIIIEKRKEILQLISDKPCTCKDYLKNSDIHIRKIDL